MPEGDLIKHGMRNAIYDAIALEIVDRSEDRLLRPNHLSEDLKELEQIVRREVLKQPSTIIVEGALQKSPDISNFELGEELNNGLQQDWKPTSGLRYANGIRRYLKWASNQ